MRETRIDRLFETIRLGALRSHLAGSLSQRAENNGSKIGMLLAPGTEAPACR